MVLMNRAIDVFLDWVILPIPAADAKGIYFYL